MLSSSKIFSYAGQRMALACISDKLFDASSLPWQNGIKMQGCSGPS